MGGVTNLRRYGVTEKNEGMTNGDLRETRKQFFSEMEQKLQETYPKEEDRMFYYHSSEDRILLSHAMFWTMT